MTTVTTTKATTRRAEGPAPRPWLRAAAALGVLALALALAGEASACPVCFGETDEQIADGVRWSMVFLGALVYVVIGGFVAMFLALRRRARRLQDPRRGLHLVHSGTVHSGTVH